VISGAEVRKEENFRLIIGSKDVVAGIYLPVSLLRNLLCTRFNSLVRLMLSLDYIIHRDFSSDSRLVCLFYYSCQFVIVKYTPSSFILTSLSVTS